MFESRNRYGVMAALAAACLLILLLLVNFQKKPERSLMAIVMSLTGVTAPQPISITVQLPGCAKGAMGAGSPSFGYAGFYTGNGLLVPVPGACPSMTGSGLRKIPAGDFETNLCLGFSAAGCQPSSQTDSYVQAAELLALSERLNQMISQKQYALQAGQAVQTKTIIVQVPAATALVSGAKVICADKAQSACNRIILQPIPLCLADASNTSCASLPPTSSYAYANSLVALSRSTQIP